ncbi:MAG: hypothetical protein JSV88_13235 [Candidatus Aminicenantes bacterium]|nr:MAG: hypothetical protein JSV88_13235 [Candidatus Aminicenantes bacterium]
MEAKQLSRFILILLLGSLCVTGYAQKKETVEDLSKRLDTLEKVYNAQLEELEVIKEKIQIAELKKEVESAKEGIKDTRNLLYWIFGITVALFLGLFTYFEKAYNKSKMRAEREIMKKIAYYFDTEESNLQRLVEEADLNRLKNKMSILVLSPVRADISFIKDFFKRARFPNVNFQYTDNITNLKSANMVLFNNDDGKFDHKEILNIIAKTKDDVYCFYFGQNRFESGDYKDRVSFANTKLQLYGNLINALRYQEFMKSK